MDSRWIVEVIDLEAFLELVEDGDLETLLADILERANVSAEITWDDAGLTVGIGDTHTAFELSGDETADVLQSALELASHLVAERGFVLASAGGASLEIAVVPRQQWDALSKDVRSGYHLVEPNAHLARPRPSRVLN